MRFSRSAPPVGWQVWLEVGSWHTCYGQRCSSVPRKTRFLPGVGVVKCRAEPRRRTSFVSLLVLISCLPESWLLEEGARPGRVGQGQRPGVLRWGPSSLAHPSPVSSVASPHPPPFLCFTFLYTSPPPPQAVTPSLLTPPLPLGRWGPRAAGWGCPGEGTFGPPPYPLPAQMP